MQLTKIKMKFPDTNLLLTKTKLLNKNNHALLNETFFNKFRL